MNKKQLILIFASLSVMPNVQAFYAVLHKASDISGSVLAYVKTETENLPKIVNASEDVNGLCGSSNGVVNELPEYTVDLPEATVNKLPEYVVGFPEVTVNKLPEYVVDLPEATVNKLPEYVVDLPGAVNLTPAVDAIKTNPGYLAVLASFTKEACKNGYNAILGVSRKQMICHLTLAAVLAGGAYYTFIYNPKKEAALEKAKQEAAKELADKQTKEQAKV